LFGVLGSIPRIEKQINAGATDQTPAFLFKQGDFMQITKRKLKLVTSNITDVVKEAIKPDTIKNIQNKFDLSFPFTVKRVKDTTGRNLPGEVGQIIIITGFRVQELRDGNQYLVTDHAPIQTKTRKYHRRVDKYKDYVLFEEN
tara:strand:- start:44493 stop:44921 length:429 start_codon:yes stop_codon:yes gene_type:complete